MKYATNFPVTINKNNTISLFDTGATISCMSEACFDNLQPKLTLVQTNTYKVNDANSNSLGPIRMTTWTLEFPKHFQQQCIIYKHIIWPVILGLDFSYNYLIGIDWFFANQLHLHQGPRSIIISDPSPFPLHCQPNIYITATMHNSWNNFSSHHTTKDISNSTCHI